MSRVAQIAPENATGAAKELLGAVKAKLGMVPNMTRILANAPAALEGYVGLSGALAHGALSAKDRELISLIVAETNGCHYCLAAHSAVGKMVGLSNEEILDSRRGMAVDSRDNAILKFAKRVVATRGNVTDDDFDEIRDAGLSDQAIVEVVANVALNLFTNYFNNAFETDIDFPRVQAVVDHHEVCATIPDCDPTR